MDLLVRTKLLTVLLVVFLSGPAGSDMRLSSGGGAGGAMLLGAQEDSGRQLRVYSETLMQGSSEEVRVDAAIGLLLRQDAAGREVLVKALRASDNPLARASVCRALIRSRGLGGTVVPADLFVEPLIDVLTGADEGVSKLAAEALLIYRFSDVEGPLMSVIKDSQRDMKVRLRGIYALQVRPEPQAFRLLIQLLDESNPEISQAAERALQESFGIPVGTGWQVWTTILEQLRQKSPEDIRRERLLRQEMRLREIQEERDRWQHLYLSALDNEFELQPPEVRGRYLLERLNSDLAPIRLWALRKMNRLSGDIEPTLRERLLALLGDSEREVRLQTARVLTTMSALNPAEKLLEQHKKETDSQVSMALFEALGEACYFALSPGSNITLPESMPREVLELAANYLKSEQAAAARLGGEVMRKLLERVKIDSAQSTVYLGSLVERYRQAAGAGGSLAGDLLMIMARLSSQGYQKEVAGQFFHDVFKEAIADKNNPEIRLAGATGLIGIDKNEAFRAFKEYGLASDSSSGIRQMVFELTGQVGDKEDLEWLSKQIGGNGASDVAWQAFRAILQKQKAAVCVDWAKRGTEQGFLPERQRFIWDLAEQKASAESSGALLEEIWTNQLKLAESVKDYSQILEISKRIKAGNARPEFVDTTSLVVFRAGVLLQQYALAGSLLKEVLARGDIGKSHPIAIFIENYLSSPDVKESEKANFVKGLKENSMSPNCPEWTEQIQRWTEVYTIKEESESSSNQ